MNKHFFENRILEWYRNNARDLLWRHTNDPYKIWLSEIILQQTRVSQGLPYYVKFTETFPTVVDLANASENDVMRLWQGLGYYSRARNLHKTAKFVAFELGGSFPNNYKELLKLKGVGPYTAAAIASFAYNEAVAVVDGNVYRILARFFGVQTDITLGNAYKIFYDLAMQFMPPSESSTFNQAMMEFGALQCTPMSPQCNKCPLMEHCFAFANKQVANLPVKSKKNNIKHRFFDYIVLIFENKIALKKRVEKDIWQDLYDFWLVESAKKNDDIESFLEQLGVTVAKVLPPQQSFLHQLTHQRIEARFWLLHLENNKEIPANLEFYTYEEIENLPKPILIDRFWKELFFI